MSTQPVIHIEGVVKTYTMGSTHVHALRGVDLTVQPGEFLDHAYRNFAEAARKWLTGREPFTAKLNPAYAPYGDYDQLMRLEEWYGRK